MEAEKAEQVQGAKAATAFDRSEALRRVWLLLNSPQCQQAKKKPQKNTDGPKRRRNRAAGVGRGKGHYPRVRKYTAEDRASTANFGFVKHYHETEEQRAERLAGYVERYHRASQNESPEERQKRLERLEEEAKGKLSRPYTGRKRSNRYEHETEEQRQKRLAKYARYNRNKLENETAASRERRLAFSKISTKRSINFRQLKKMKLMENNHGEADVAAAAPDTTTATTEHLAKSIVCGTLERATGVMERRRMVAEAVDKEHLEDMVAQAEEAIMRNIKSEPLDHEENPVEEPLRSIKVEPEESASAGESTPIKILAPMNNQRAPLLRVKTEKPDHVCIAETPEITNSTGVKSASETPFQENKSANPGTDSAVANDPRPAAELTPALEDPSGQPAEVMIVENLPRADVISIPILHIKTDHAPIEDLCARSVLAPSVDQRANAQEAPTLHISAAEKADHGFGGHHAMVTNVPYGNLQPLLPNRVPLPVLLQEITTVPFGSFLLPSASEAPFLPAINVKPDPVAIETTLVNNTRASGNTSENPDEASIGEMSPAGPAQPPVLDINANHLPNQKSGTSSAPDQLTFEDFDHMLASEIRDATSIVLDSLSK